MGGVRIAVDILLSTMRMNRIEHYDPGDLTVVIDAGTCFADVQHELAAHNQWLPYDASSLESATLGGSRQLRPPDL